MKLNWGLAAAIVGCVVFWALLYIGLQQFVFTSSSSRVCISTIGPVDQYGRGDTTPEMKGDCP